MTGKLLLVLNGQRTISTEDFLLRALLLPGEFLNCLLL